MILTKRSGQPPSLFHHVIEHHCDLRHRPADVPAGKNIKAVLALTIAK